MSLSTILAKHRQPAGLAGAPGTAAFARDLRRHARLTVVIYAALFAVLLALMTLLVWMVVMDSREGRSIRTAILAGAGISCPIILELMRRTVREWGRTDLVAVLARRLDSGRLQAVIEALLKADG